MSKYIQIVIATGLYNEYNKPCNPDIVWQKDGCEEREIIQPARIISPSLAIYQYEKRTSYDPPWYHVIHIPTGLVIAAVEYDLVSSVKKTFEDNKWTLRSENTLVMIPKAQNEFQRLYHFKPLEWEMTCLIRYKIIEGNDNV